MEKLRVFATFERSNHSSKSNSKDWNDVNINVVSRTFHEYMSKGNVNSAIKLLSNSIEGGVLPLNKETIALLSSK